MPTDLVVVGLSHHSAPLTLREKLAFAADDLDNALRELTAQPSVGEAVLLSTCNRVEIYACTAPGPAASLVHGATGELRHFLARRRGVSAEVLAGHLYEHVGRDAVRHVFRVASALDSLVVGESQILGQLKDAFGAASRSGALGPLLGHCLERAFGVAKRVRTETAIARGGANVSSVAVELARRIFGDLAGRRVLVVGAGKMSDLAARHLRADGAAEILVTNRSPERAEALARRVEGTARPFAELDRLLAAADIVLCSTGSPEPIITEARMRPVMKARRHRPIFLIDIAVPRDVEANVARLDGAYLFDIDDLQKVVADNLKERRMEAVRAEKIVEAEAGHFMSWLRSQDVVPTIKDLRERFQQVARLEVERTLTGLKGRLDETGETAVRRLAESIVNKLLHSPLTALKQGDAEQAEQLVAAARTLFALPEEGPAQVAAAPPSPPAPVAGGKS